METHDIITELRDFAEVQEFGTLKNLLEEAADRLEELDERVAIMGAEPDAGGWTSVDERLPAQDQLVIAAVFGHDCIVLQSGETVEQAIERVQRECRYTTVAYIAEDGWTKYNGYPMIVHPSYWMPLPEPPKEV